MYCDRRQARHEPLPVKVEAALLQGDTLQPVAVPGYIRVLEYTGLLLQPVLLKWALLQVPELKKEESKQHQPFNCWFGEGVCCAMCCRSGRSGVRKICTSAYQSEILTADSYIVCLRNTEAVPLERKRRCQVGDSRII